MKSGVALARTSLTQRALDYVELCKPRLSLLVLLTVAAGFFAAELSGVAMFPTTLGLVGALFGVAFCAGGAATLNQYIERDLDACMERTKGRPLPAGRLAPEAALLFGLLLLGCGGVTLQLCCNAIAAGLGLTSAVIYVAIYTPLKRITTFNTLAGAVVGALPPMIGWVAATGGLESGAWLLFAILFVWQLPHFFAIAWFYREDYGRAGMHMLGVDDEDGRVTMRQIMLFTLTMVPVSLMPAISGLTGELYFYSALVLGGGLVLLGLRLVRTRTRMDARRLFVGSLVYLPCLLGLLLFDSVR